MKSPSTKILAADKIPVFPKTPHRLRPNSEVAVPNGQKVGQYFFQIPRHARGPRHAGNENLAKSAILSARTITFGL
jgi:hypothetical protein